MFLLLFSALCFNTHALASLSPEEVKHPNVQATAPDNTSTKPQVTVLIDPGHGGVDTGASYEHAKESTIVLSISEKLAAQLNSNSQLHAVLTRETNKHMNLEQRVKQAEKNDAQIFISLHANAAPETSAKGFEMFVFTPKGSQPLSKRQVERDQVVGTIVKDLQQQTRFFQSLKVSQDFSEQLPGPVKSGDFYVLRKAKIPAILFEVGFLTNPRDRSRLLKEDYQEELARKMAEAIRTTVLRLDSFEPNEELWHTQPHEKK